MKPAIEALQFFYGTIPLIVTLIAMWLRSDMLLRDILRRLDAIEAAVDATKTAVLRIFIAQIGAAPAGAESPPRT